MQSIKKSNKNIENVDKNKRKSICGICFDELTQESRHSLTCCNCTFCKNCLDRYFQMMIDEGQPRIYCPAFECLVRNHPIPLDEINQLVESEKHRGKLKNLFERRNLFQKLFDNQKDGRSQQAAPATPQISQCPFCEHLFESSSPSLPLPPTPSNDNLFLNDNNNNNLMEINKSDPSSQVLFHKCPKCSKISCSQCFSKLSDENTKHDCRDLNETILNQLDIKRCPNCHFLIQREGGCAQISCRNCSHVFCWHCLKLLDNDFLLFHYDSGPCKNKLGHSRFMIYLNRAQTITVCVGFGILMFLASPVIIILLPCVLTRKCRMCRERQKQRKRKDSKII